MPANKWCAVLALVSFVVAVVLAFLAPHYVLLWLCVGLVCIAASLLLT